MARQYARTHVSIWQDADFQALPPLAQRLYLFLLSQPNLSHLGVLPLTLRRWRPACGTYTTDELRADLADLAAARFVVVDEEAEEVLVRTLLRNDGVWKSPNVLRSAAGSAKAVQSSGIKRALLAEVDRIDTSELSDEPGKNDQSPRQVIDGLLQGLRDDLAVPLPSPSPNGSGNPSGNGSENPDTRALPLPLPLPTTTSPSAVARPPAEPARMDGTRLLTEHCSRLKDPLPRAVKRTLGEKIDQLLGEDVSAVRIERGLTLMRSKGSGPGLLPHLVAEADSTRGPIMGRDSEGRACPPGLEHLPPHERFVAVKL